jgi:photosystem II stability/assembly factor-like uncharacterized protein
MAIAVHPTNPSVVFATGRAEIGQDTIRPSFFKSTDAGVSWDTVSLDTTDGYTYSLAVDPSDHEIIYISGRHRFGPGTRPRIFKSTDGGATFATVYSDTIRSTVYSVRVHPTNSNIIYASRLKKILRSTDAGGSWSEMYDCGSTVYSLATSPADSDVVYAAKDAIVFKSTDAGVSWFETDSGLQGRCIYGLAVKSTDADVVYATNQRFNYDNSGFYKTTNGGTDWFSSNQGISEARIPGFALAPSSPSTIYSEYYIVSVYKSTNSGNDWAKLPYFPCCYIADELAVHNADPDTVLCIEGSG